MTTMHGVSRFLAETLDSSVEFKDFVTATIDAELSYLIYPDMTTLLSETLPLDYVSIATYDNVDETGVEFSFRTAFFVTIKRYDNVVTGKITEEPTFEKLELIVLKAKSILQHEMSLFGIQQDKNIKIDIFNMFTPAPTGEEGLRMEIDIQMSKDLFLC